MYLKRLGIATLAVLLVSSGYAAGKKRTEQQLIKEARTNPEFGKNAEKIGKKVIVGDIPPPPPPLLPQKNPPSKTPPPPPPPQKKPPSKTPPPPSTHPMDTRLKTANKKQVKKQEKQVVKRPGSADLINAKENLNKVNKEEKKKATVVDDPLTSALKARFKSVHGDEDENTTDENTNDW